MRARWNCFWRLVWRDIRMLKRSTSSTGSQETPSERFCDESYETWEEPGNQLLIRPLRRHTPQLLRRSVCMKSWKWRCLSLKRPSLHRIWKPENRSLSDLSEKCHQTILEVRRGNCVPLHTFGSGGREESLRDLKSFKEVWCESMAEKNYEAFRLA